MFQGYIAKTKFKKTLTVGLVLNEATQINLTEEDNTPTWIQRAIYGYIHDFTFDSNVIFVSLQQNAMFNSIMQ